MADPKNDDFLDDIETAEAESRASETEEPDPAALEAEELEALRSERDDYRERFMRALADAENSRKRADKERRDAENYGGTRLARDLLPVHDNLHRAVSVAGEIEGDAHTALVEGVELTLKELKSVFKKHGIEEIAPQVGDRFDPKHHEAMFEAPVPNTKAGDIIQVSAVGFMLHDRLLRPAQVGVSSTPAS